MLSLLYGIHELMTHERDEWMSSHASVAMSSPAAVSRSMV
jgi:hypothetical protein